MEIQGKVFAISGTSSGLGQAVATMIIEQGGSVIGLDIKNNDEYAIRVGSQFRWFACDVRSETEVKETLGAGADHFRKLHGAIACAGIAPARTLYSSKRGSHPYELFQRVVEINLGGTFNLFNQSIPFLVRNESEDVEENGVLIATSSIAAGEGQAGQAAYAASKGGVSGLVLPLARELSRRKIRVNAIAPGIFQTPISDAFPAEVKTSLAAQVPFPARLGNPAEFAALVRTLITNSYMNGTVYRLDGGVRMQ